MLPAGERQGLKHRDCYIVPPAGPSAGRWDCKWSCDSNARTLIWQVASVLLKNYYYYYFYFYLETQRNSSSLCWLTSWIPTTPETELDWSQQHGSHKDPSPWTEPAAAQARTSASSVGSSFLRKNSRRRVVGQPHQFSLFFSFFI